MPSQASFYDDPYYQSYTLANPRYHQGSFSSAPTQPTPAILAPTTETLTSYGTRPSWTTGSQHTGSEYGSPSGTPYSEYGPSSEQDYYASSANATVGYPESSQRTHVSGATYPTMYSTRYTDALANAPSRIPGTPEEEQVSFRYADASHSNYSPHHHSSPIPSDTNRRTDHGSWRDASDPSSAFDRLPSQIAASYPRTDAVSQLNGQGSVPYLLARSPPVSVSPPHDARTDYSSRQMGRVSPRLPVYAYSRLPGISRLDEPGNPSVVPPLVFDGEEYDDESECSLPSAASDAYRSAYQPVQSPAQFSSSTSESGLSYSAPIPQSGRSDARSLRDSATPPPDSPRMAERPNSERSKSSHKKSKMHQCGICNKWFPRPSGLATHMNSHSGAKPYKCPIPSCTKSFAVRSNAKRHLRTHGIFPTSEHSSAPTQFTVGFDAPIVSEVHDVGKLPGKLRWVPQSLATRTNVDFLRDAPSDSEDEYPPSCPVLSVPLPAVIPSSPKWEGGDFEERNSYEDMGPSPYLNSQQWRGLPGPAIVTPTSL